MSRHVGGIKGYEFTKAICPSCLRSIAISFLPDGKTIRFRKHLRNRRDGPCRLGGTDYPRAPIEECLRKGTVPDL